MGREKIKAEKTDMCWPFLNIMTSSETRIQVGRSRIFFFLGNKFDYNVRNWKVSGAKSAEISPSVSGDDIHLRSKETAPI